MADRENRDYDDTEGSLDPELLYTKEYCIGSLAWDTSTQVGGWPTDSNTGGGSFGKVYKGYCYTLR